MNNEMHWRLATTTTVSLAYPGNVYILCLMEIYVVLMISLIHGNGFHIEVNVCCGTTKMVGIPSCTINLDFNIEAWKDDTTNIITALWKPAIFGLVMGSVPQILNVALSLCWASCMDLSRVHLKPGRPLDGKLRRLVDNGGTNNTKTKPLHIPETSNSTFLGIVEEITINRTLLRIVFTSSGLIACVRK